MQRLQRLGRGPGPVRQGRAIENDAAAGVHLGLAIQRRVIAVLGDHDVGDGGFGQQPALDQARRRRGLHYYFLASAAAVLGSADHQGPEGRRDHVQPLGHVLADPVQRAGAAGTGLVLDVDHLFDPRQMSRQGSTVGPPLGRARRLLGRRRQTQLGAGQFLLKLLQRQHELIGIQLFRSGAEGGPLEIADDPAQSRDQLVVGRPGVLVGGALPVARLKLSDVVSAFRLEQLPEGLGVHVARRFHTAEMTIFGSL